MKQGDIIFESIPLKQLVREPVGTKGVYIVANLENANDIQHLAGSYAVRAGGTVASQSFMLTHPSSDAVQRMVMVTVTQQGNRRRPRGRKAGVAKHAEGEA